MSAPATASEAPSAAPSSNSYARMRLRRRSAGGRTSAGVTGNTATIQTHALLSGSPAFDSGDGSLGEAYYNQGNKPLALLNYKKSLQLDPANDNAKKIITELDK